MYNLIVARNATNGIGKCDENTNSIPWETDRVDMQYFKSRTMGQIVIMGRKTWESLPKKPLPKRINIVLTSQTVNYGGCLTFKSIKLCDKYLNEHENYSKLERWVIGGESVYNEYMQRELISEVLISQFKSSEECNRHFHWLSNGSINEFELISINKPQPESRFKLLHYIRRNHEELALHNAMREIIDTGFTRDNRTGIKTKAIFGKMFEYRMVEKIDPKTGESMFRIPLLTTKKMFCRGIFAELKWFLNGRVDSKELEKKGVNIWKGNTTREFLDNSNLSEYEEGETGPIYGFQWKHWGAKYVQGKKDYQNEGIDQVQNVIQSLQDDPFSRRHIISGWNVEDLDKMCLPPCFTSKALVLTKTGYKEIQSLLDNDLVLTHLGNWKPIINRQKRLYNEKMYMINHAVNGTPIAATNEHPFLVKTAHMTNLEPLSYTLSEETSWVAAENLEPHKHVLCVPIIQEEVPVSITITLNGEFKENYPIDYFMIGYYIGHRGNFLDVEFVPPGWSILREFTKNNSENPSLCNIIPEWVQSLPKSDLEQFIKGFESSARVLNNSFNAVNELMALDLQRIYAKLEKPTRIYLIGDDAVITHIIDDFNKRLSIDGKYMYVPILEIESYLTNEYVYNLEVADDNSYVVENIATHNCHVLYQFMVHEQDDQKYLSLMMTQRSCDTFLGLPFNICSLGMFLFLMAKSVGMKPYKIIHSIADMHIYENHIPMVQEQLKRSAYAFPYIKLRTSETKRIEDYEFSDIEIVDYYSHGSIKADMAC